MNKLFLVYLAFFLAVVFAQPAKESNSIFVDKRGEGKYKFKTSLVLSSLQILLHISVLFPKNRPECPSDKYTQCFLEVTATIGTCALGIVGSLTIEGWFSVSFLTRYLPTPILKLSVFVIHSLTYRLLPALMRSMALNMIVMDVFVIFLNGFVITHVIYQ